MPTMTISPIKQPDYITRKEFSDFRMYVEEGFEKTNEHIDNLETKVDNLKIYMNEGFVKTNEHIDNLEKGLKSYIDTSKKETVKEIISYFKTTKANK